MPTYYFSNISRVNDMLGANAIEFAQLRQQLGDLLRQAHGVLATQVDHLLGHAELEVPARQLHQLAAILAIPSVLQRAPDVGRVAPDGLAGLVELADQGSDELDVAARYVPDVCVARGQLQRGLALGADPEGRIRFLDRLGIGDRVGHLVVAAVEVRALLGEQRFHDLQRLAEAAHTVVEPLDAVHRVLDLRPRRADAELQPATR